jgi:integrase
MRSNRTSQAEAAECDRRHQALHRKAQDLVSRPRVLAPEQFHLLLPLIREPYRTMVLIAGRLGLRVSEIVALQWRDFDFPGFTLLVQRSVVHARIGDVKTEYSRDSVPLDPAVVGLWCLHKERSFSTPEGWLFANPATGRPYHQEEIQKKHICKAGVAAGIGGESAGIRFDTAIGPGWIKPGRLSPSKRS